MPLYRAQVSIAADSLLARDQIVNVLYFDDAGATTDPEGLAGDLADIYQTGWLYDLAQVRVKMYGVGPGHHLPVADVVRNEGTVLDSQGPREIALCLSYYSERNQPSRRGRIYLPICLYTNHSYGRRPQPSQIAQVVGMGAAFSGLGGADVDWVAYSPTTGDHWDVSHVWCDDEWDVQRRRGLRASTRTLNTVSG